MPECGSTGIGYSNIHREVLGAPVPPPPVAVVGDPHLMFAHGGKADFRGEHESWYNFLSAKNVSLNLFFVNADFKRPAKQWDAIHGSHMAQMAMSVRTMLTGKLFTIEYAATAKPPHKIIVRDEAGKVAKIVTHGSGNFVFENLVVSMRVRESERSWKQGTFAHVTAVVNTMRWMVEVTSKPWPNAKLNPGKALLDVKMSALYDADKDVVAPHGLIGQSYDGDGVGVSGKLDNYMTTAREITTTAMAEGAIEGVAADYEVADRFATDFKYSRFNAVAAKPRDVSKLAGERVVGKKTFSIGASPDVEEPEEEKPAVVARK